MQPVVDITYSPTERFFDILIIMALSVIMIQLRNRIEQSMLMRYYTFWENNVWSASLEWIQKFEESIQIAYATIDKYTSRDCEDV